MANTLKLVGNSIELNRNLSSADVGVLGPFTIQAAQSGMSAAANFNLAVSGAAGPVPLPSPYPLQPGFTAISDPSQITGPGNYQLTNNVVNLSFGTAGVTLDCAGFNITGQVDMAAPNCLLKNAYLSGGIGIGGSNNTIANSWINSIAPSSGYSQPFIILGSAVTVSHCLLTNDSASGIDDLIATDGPLTGLNFLYNIVQNTFDVGIEGAGGWDHCTFTGNYFTNVNWAMGGFYDTNHNFSSFTATYCLFQNNTVHASGSYSNTMFIFNSATANDDATANSLWGGSGTSLVNNNTFSGNVRQ